jgi:hypothetical protein
MAVDDIDEEIRKVDGQIAWLQKRVVELEEQAASLPTVGFHRQAFKDTKRMIRRVRESLAEEQEFRAWLDEERKWDAEMQAIVGQEQPASFWEEFEKKFEREQNDRLRERDLRATEAEKRRAAFRLIEGGKE